MTFNLRHAGSRPPHTWAERRTAMAALLRGAAPAVIGTQEGLYQQLRDIEQDLGGRYAWIGTGRSGGSRGEFMAVFYDTGSLAPVEYEHYWLSDSPDVIASNTWGGSSIRMVTWVRLRDLRTNGEFYVINTHLDVDSALARTRSAALILRRTNTLDPSLPVILTGDFNVPAHADPVYDVFRYAGLVDTWDAAERRGEQYATFHGYGPLEPGGDRIDWILTSPEVQTVSAEIDTFSLGDRFPSDHLPVRARLRLPYTGESPRIR
ncbi:endonuclease/exonuclease/phosphatase family protein [Streptomyces sp. NPDC050418]|uniref:endonuclease/exonuclease/phosphatase family protein n=1 Tax=Streptomyces sp. NPDC050418 TaxID=3365612 RepID=UPI0037B9C12F